MQHGSGAQLGEKHHPDYELDMKNRIRVLRAERKWSQAKQFDLPVDQVFEDES